jgi:hypothetical protein
VQKAVWLKFLRHKASRHRPARLGAVLAAPVLILTVLLAGCAQMDAALGKQWVTVVFGPNTKMATVLKVRQACSHIPNAVPEPLPKGHSVLDEMNSVRYTTTNATPANLAELQSCLQKFKAVVGVNSQDAGDDGT